MQKFSILVLFTLSLLGCVVQPLPTQVSTPNTSLPTLNIIYTASPTPEEIELPPMVTPSPFPTGVFFFGPTPSGNQVGGINGVFYRQYLLDEQCPWIYDILRFYEDGLVMTSPVCETAAEDVARHFLDQVWPETSKWLNRENGDPTLSRGIYYMAENKVWFTAAAENETVVVDYFGTLSEDLLTLNSFSHFNGNQATDRDFIYVPLSNSP